MGIEHMAIYESDLEKAIFARKKPNANKLRAYGFACENGGYAYAADMLDGQFRIGVSVASDGALRTRMIDNATGEEYVLHRTPGAKGAFVGRIREQYTQLLMDIAQRCYEPDVFKSEQAKEAIAHVRAKYGDELEFLWKKFPDNAVWRRKDTGKWYGALLTISARKLGLDSDERIEIIDLRMEPDSMSGLIDNERYFPGYHMNKKHWYTICLNGSVRIGEILGRIDESYRLAKK